MSAATKSRRQEARTVERRATLLLSLVILLGLGSAAALNRWLELNRPPADPALEEEKLYVTGAAARRMSLGFNGLIADWYWMRSLQYVGRKIVRFQDQQGLEGVPPEDISTLNLQQLAPLLDTTTTLDPQFIPAYEYGAVVLPAINPADADEDAIALLRKGIEANPAAWKLYHYLGYIYWQRREYDLASETYDAGAKLPGAPKWMEAMVAQMKFQGNDPKTARAIYGRMYEQADDPQVKNMVRARLWQIDSLKERQSIRLLLDEHQRRTGRCLSSWPEVAANLRAAGLQVEPTSGAPLDPSGAPYRLVENGCDVDLAPESKVPRK